MHIVVLADDKTVRGGRRPKGARWVRISLLLSQVTLTMSQRNEGLNSSGLCVKRSGIFVFSL